MYIRKLTFIVLLLLVFIPTAYSGVAESYEWQMSDYEDFSSYEPCGYGKELVLTKALYGKYIRFVYTDFYGNADISDIKGPVKYEGKNVITFEGSNWVVEDKDNDEHYVKCVGGRLYAVNADVEDESDNAYITLPDKADTSDKYLAFRIGAEDGHQRMKLIFLNDEKETVFIIWATRREDKLYLLNTGSSQLSTALYKADIGSSMEIMLGFDFEKSKVLIKNRLTDEWSREISIDTDFSAVSAKNVCYMRVSNEYTPCNAWVDDVRFLSEDGKPLQKKVAVWGQREPDGMVIAEVYNYSNVPVSVMIAVAFYENEQLSDVKIINTVLKEAKEGFEFKSGKSYDKVRFFVWDKEKEQYPMTKALED